MKRTDIAPWEKMLQSTNIQSTKATTTITATTTSITPSTTTTATKSATTLIAGPRAPSTKRRRGG